MTEALLPARHSPLSLFSALRRLPQPLEGLRVSPTGRAWRETNLDAACHNAQVLQNALPAGCRLMAVVKADAYGHGAVPLSLALQREGVDAFAVACLSEGIALRRRGVRGTILILGYTPPEEAPLLQHFRLQQAVADLSHGEALSAQRIPLRVHLALDTGMHRLGIPAADREALLTLFRLPHLQVEGVFSHLCTADSPTPRDAAFARRQLALFEDAVQCIRNAGLNPGAVHLQASTGIWTLPPQPGSAYARAGIALYGVQSSPGCVPCPLPLRPVLSLRARVASVRTISAGERAGYGLAFQAARDTRLAVVTIGYADGLPACLTQQGGEVLLSGRRCPMVGRMCMDQLLVDVTAVPQAVAGDTVTLIGEDGGREIRAEEVAQKCGILTNEFLAGLGHRLPVVCR